MTAILVTISLKSMVRLCDPSYTAVYRTLVVYR